MDSLKKMGFKSVAMALRDVLSVLMILLFWRKRSWRLFLEQKEMACPVRRLQTVITQ